MDCFLGIDLGTSSVRVLALDSTGSVLAVHAREYEIRQPYPGYAEQLPEDWWQATCECMQWVLSTESVRTARIRSIGLSGQMHGLVLLDSDGYPLRDAIIWPDRRTAGICTEWLQDIGAEFINSITGLPLASGFFAVSLAWVKRYEPQVYRRVAHALLPKDYIRYRLTGLLATDTTDASGTLLFNIFEKNWSNQLIKVFNLDDYFLPSIQEPTALAGELTVEAAEDTGLKPGTPVAIGGADQAMAAISLGVCRPGVVAIAISTGGTVITAIDRPLQDFRVHTLCHIYPNLRILMGATLSAGLSLSWFAKNVHIISSDSYTETDSPNIEELTSGAEKISPGSEDLIFTPYLCGERTPYMDPNARGCFIGLSLRHTHFHMVRSIMEGVAYSLCESLDIFHELDVPVNKVICSGGGSRSSLWRQIQADIYGVSVTWNRGEEHSATGAAIVAGIAIGESGLNAAARNRMMDVTEPRHENTRLYNSQRKIFKRIYPQLAGIFHDLSKSRDR
ncbi:MAG: xylulokinase [Spirochaetota bacterium]